MNLVRYGRAPFAFALRRMRMRFFSVLALTAALAGAGTLIGWSSLTSALAQEKSVRLQLRSQPQTYRSLDVRYYTLPGESDYRAGRVEATFRSFDDVVPPARRVQVWHSLDPDNPNGIRLVVAREARQDVVVRSGRLPQGCRHRVCEALALTGRERLGQRIALGKRRFALIVGRGSLEPRTLPDASDDLGTSALLVRAVSSTLRPLVAEDGSTVIYSSPLDPNRVRGYGLAQLGDRMRRAITRLERGDPLVRASAPLSTIDSLAERGRVARERLLLVAGQAAALVVAFSAFVASARRRETELADSQLTTLGASRRQIWTARVVEALIPAIGAYALAIAGLIAAAVAIAAHRGLSMEFVRAALPAETLVAIAGSALLGFTLLLVSAQPPRRSRFGFGTLEIAALTALGIVVWQTWTTGALEPERIADHTSPVILLLPALGFFAAGVLLLRVLPLALRASARVARHGPAGVRLAFLMAARNPAQAAAATTFLAIALGTALFGLNYRATLEQQARDQARFTTGAAWRVAERGRAREAGVTPLTQFANLTSERPTPAVRLDGNVVDVSRQGGIPSVRVLAVPAASLQHVLGWRDNFSSLSPAQIAARLRPNPIRLRGPRLATTTDALRVWARSQTDYPRMIVLHLLLPGQNFAALRLGVVWRHWQRLEVTLPKALRGAELVGVGYPATYTPIDFKYDPEGFVDIGRIEQRRSGDWSTLPSLANWTQTTSPDGTAGVLVTMQVRHAPVARTLRFDLNGTRQPLIHPKLGLPSPRPGFENGPIPVLASGPVAARAVDRLLTIDLPGKQIEGRVVGTARLFPTITESQSSFVVVDYDTLFAVMNADQPGLLEPSEAWFFHSQQRGATERTLRLFHVVDEQQLERALLDDPLAAGTRTMLTISALVASALSLIGLILAARSALVSERPQLAEYEALGVARSVLRRSAQLRLFALSLLGIAAGLLGGFVSVRLTGAFVAVTGTAKRPLPPIATVIAWPAAAVVLGALTLTGAVGASLVARHALRESSARRLRA